MARNIFDQSPEEADHEEHAEEEAKPHFSDIEPREPKPDRTQHIQDVQKLREEMNVPMALCPKCKVVAVKLKARIDDGHIERYLYCTNCHNKLGPSERRPQ